jgi:hypothetical protein
MANGIEQVLMFTQGLRHIVAIGAVGAGTQRLKEIV